MLHQKVGVLSADSFNYLVSSLQLNQAYMFIVLVPCFLYIICLTFRGLTKRKDRKNISKRLVSSCVCIHVKLLNKKEK